MCEETLKTHRLLKLNHYVVQLLFHTLITRHKETFLYNLH